MFSKEIGSLFSHSVALVKASSLSKKHIQPRCEQTPSENRQTMMLAR